MLKYFNSIMYVIATAIKDFRIDYPTNNPFVLVGQLFMAYRVKNLARLALELAAVEYESQNFKWIQRYEFKDGEVFNSSVRTDRPEFREQYYYPEGMTETQTKLYEDPTLVYKHATQGCLLGGVARAAWMIVGKPEFGTPKWDLKLAVEDKADRILTKSLIGYIDEYVSVDNVIAGRNDGCIHETGEAVKALREAADIA